jgi:hypothetical protein
MMVRAREDCETVDCSVLALELPLAGGQRSKLGPRQVKLAREMYEETGSDGKRAHTVAEIAAELGVTRPTIYRALEPSKALALVMVPGMLAGALGAGVHVGPGQHLSTPGYYPAAAIYALTYGRAELPHNEPAGEFIRLEGAPTMGTADPMRGPQVWPGGLP